MTKADTHSDGWFLAPGSIVYVGNSMYPTLEAPEIIYFVPYGQEPVRRGDVIVFDSPVKDKSVTHRVISVTSEGIKTRGDNNDIPDPWALQKQDITGRVIYARRGKQLRPIYGGLRGDIASILAMLRRKTGILLFTFIFGLFQASARLGLGRLPGVSGLSSKARRGMRQLERHLCRRSPKYCSGK